MNASSMYFEQDGITYLLTVEPVGHKWVGKWNCTKCGTRGESSPECDSEQLAYNAASTNLQGHHFFDLSLRLSVITEN